MPIPEPDLHEGQRVYHRHRDLFGYIVSIDRRLDDDRALVKYEWPWDPEKPPEDVPLKELVSALSVGVSNP